MFSRRNCISSTGLLWGWDCSHWDPYSIPYSYRFGGEWWLGRHFSGWIHELLFLVHLFILNFVKKNLSNPVISESSEFERTATIRSQRNPNEPCHYSVASSYTSVNDLQEKRLTQSNAKQNGWTLTWLGWRRIEIERGIAMKNIDL